MKDTAAWGGHSRSPTSPGGRNPDRALVSGSPGLQERRGSAWKVSLDWSMSMTRGHSPGQ